MQQSPEIRDSVPISHLLSLYSALILGQVKSSSAPQRMISQVSDHHRFIICPLQSSSSRDEDVEEPDDGQVEVAEPRLRRAVCLSELRERPAQAESLHHRLGQGEGQAGRVHR